MKALTRDGNVLQYVPETLKTKEMCLEAVTRTGQALEYVPEAVKTEQLCM